jgi:diacylglycerol kinase (ATP)
MIRIGLISNPRSQRNKQGFEEIRAAVAGVPDVLHESLENGVDVGEILREFARREVGVVAVNGGDGTLQVVLTRLFEGGSFERPPPIAILPRGMANMAAADVGLRGRSAAALPRLIEAARAGSLEPHLRQRHVLRVENIQGRTPQRGMFLGAAGLYDGITVAYDRMHPLGLKGEWAAAAALIASVGEVLLGRRHRIRAHQVAITVDGQPREPGRYLLVLASTLDRLSLNARPFWNKSSGPIRFTSITDPPKRLLRWAPTLLYGSTRRQLPEECYFSRGARRVELDMDSPFAVDGEMLAPIPGKPIVLSADDRAVFVRL